MIGDVVETMEGLRLTLVRQATNAEAHPDDGEDPQELSPNCYWAQRRDTREEVLLWGWERRGTEFLNWSVHRLDVNYSRHKQWRRAA